MKDKIINIVVNGKVSKYSEKKISFKEVVIIAFGKYEDNDAISYTVSYTNQGGQDKQLLEGKETVVFDGIEFDADRTDRS